MDAFSFPNKRKIGDVVIEEAEASPLHLHLLSQTVELVEAALGELVCPLNKTGSSRGHSASARDQLVRAATLLEVVSVSQTEAAGGSLEGAPASFSSMLPTVKRILNMLVMLPGRLSSHHAEAKDSSSAWLSGAEGGQRGAQSGHSSQLQGEQTESESEDELVENDVDKQRQRGFADVIGNEAAKQVLHDNLVLPLSISAELRKKLYTGIRGGVGNVLLYGPPGTGKTMLVTAASQEAGARLVLIKPSDILSKYNGESEASLKRIFSMARKQSGDVSKRRPIVLFFDEFDSLAVSRSNGEDGLQGRRLLAELLLQLNELKAVNSQASSWEGKGQCCAVVVVAATNRIEDIDEAAVRRFDTRVYVGLPETNAERVQLIKSFLRPGNVAHACTANDLADVARMTEGWSGSDIECMCRDAAMAPLRRLFPLFAPALSSQGPGARAAASASASSSAASASSLLITAEDFFAACERATSLAPRSSIKGDECCAEA